MKFPGVGNISTLVGDALETWDTVIVGGGPAGSSCAWQLRRKGVDCMVLDRQEFPRTKLCAGWITPEVVRDLELDSREYPQGLLSFDGIYIHIRSLGFKFKTIQHSIRRYEFDDWLLKRTGAPVYTHYVRNIRRENGYYIIDDQYRCKYLIGAGGTKCPVYRTFFKDANPRAKDLQAVTLEQEFPYQWHEPNCHLWFFAKGLPGYSWYVPKENGYLNVGVGGMAHKLKLRDDDIKHHWGHFTQALRRDSFVEAGYAFSPGGYSYYLRGGVDVGQIDNAFIVGDAAGLATRDLCEGIGPAVKSGLLAADAIADNRKDYSLVNIERYSVTNGLMKKLLEYMFIKRKEKARQGKGATMN